MLLVDSPYKIVDSLTKSWLYKKKQFYVTMFHLMGPTAMTSAMIDVIQVIIACVQPPQLPGAGQVMANHLNMLRPGQNGLQFPDGIFKCIFLNENIWNSINISQKFILKSPINIIPALVRIMALHWPGVKPLSELMMVSLLMHICVKIGPIVLTINSLKPQTIIRTSDGKVCCLKYMGHSASVS